MKEMKESNSLILGLIPASWSSSKLKYCLKEPMKYGASEAGIDYDDTLPRYIRITDITSDGKLKDENKLSLGEKQSIGYILKDNTVLFARSGGTVGKTFLYRESFGKAAFAGYLISAVTEPTKMLPEWLIYFSNSSCYWEWVNQIFTQATIQNIGADKYSNMPIPIAPIEVQKRIISYLDLKCSEIDGLSSNIQSEIDTLEAYKRSVITEAVTKGLDKNAPMKDSGLPWVGKVPQHWMIEKVKYHLTRKETKNQPDKQVLSVYREYGVIPKDSRDDNHNVTSEDTSKYKYVKQGNLVINKMKAWQGSMGVSDYEGIVSPAYFIYHFTDNLLVPKYLHYLFRSCYKDEFRRISGGIREGQWDLDPDEFANTMVLLPPVQEQKEIIQVIDGKTNEIEATIAKKKEQLEILADYKKSLIYEYVTGKKEVPTNG